MKVLKFGGSTLNNAEQIIKVVSLIVKTQKEEKICALVFSALYGVTDLLEESCLLAVKRNGLYLKKLSEIEKKHVSLIDDIFDDNERGKLLVELRVNIDRIAELLNGVALLRELSPRIKDMVFSFGECLACMIMTKLLQNYGVRAEFIDAREIIRTDDKFGKAAVDFPVSYKLIGAKCDFLKFIPVVTGFIASSADGETTTLGRDGSDFTASILAAALNAKELELWKDVDGMMTADPRKVEGAFTIESMTYEEAMEMSYFGARVIYPPTLQPVMEKLIPIRIKNINRPDFGGTLIGPDPFDRKYLIKGLSSIDNISLIRVEGSGMVGVSGTAMRIFATLAMKEINVILITQASSEYSICLAVEPHFAELARQCIEEEFRSEIERNQIRPVVLETDQASIAVVGENMRRSPIITSTLFKALERNGVDVVAIAQGSSELNISVVVKREDETKALNSLHDHFFAPFKRRINLFMVGTGLIGTTLLQQMCDQAAYLAEKYSLELRVVALANSKNMVFNAMGFNLWNWPQALEASVEEMIMENFVERMKKMNLANSVFVDCTANEEITDHYADILKASISIVTPNKKANSADYEKYALLKKCERKYGSFFLYETNVGAGLPIIGTLNDLLLSGDVIISIEAILSGTLSYIFNTFNDSMCFSDVVREAQKLGFTEPDPRDDLNGMDVARKILILAREAGYQLEIKDVLVEKFLPEACFKAASVGDFFEELKKNDEVLRNKTKIALLNGKRLRYIATFEGGKARVGLSEVDRNHSFYELSGSDNIVAFKTNRYANNPLVVKGPGAGADVTAGGVFADIIRLAN